MGDNGRHSSIRRPATAVGSILIGLGTLAMLTGCGSDDPSITAELVDGLEPIKLGSDPMTAFEWSPDGRLLATASIGGRAGPPLIQVSEVGVDGAVDFLEGHTAPITELAWGPDGGSLASAGEDGTVRVWDVEREEMTFQLIDEFGENVVIAWSPDGSTLATGDIDGVVLWDPETGEQVDSIPTHAVLMQWSPDGDELMTADATGAVSLWAGQEFDVTTITFDGDAIGVIFDMAWSPDGSTIATVGVDETVDLWDAETGERRLAPLTGHAEAIRTVAWSPGGSVLATGGEDDRIRFWNASTGEPIGRPLAAHDSWVLHLAWGSDGRLASAGDLVDFVDAQFFLWDFG